MLIEDDTIAEVGQDIEADAEVIDVSGDIVIPGFVDTHRHTWEAAIRNCAPDATLDDYFVEVLDSFAPLYRPEDVYASNLAGALECINAGITTLVDWSHINNTPDHPDGGVQGLKEAGIRAVYAYGSANTSLADYWFGSTIVIPRDDVERIKSTYASSDDGLITMALATRGPGFCQDDVVREEWGFARELGIPVTTHIAMGKLAGKWSMVKQLDGLGLLGSDTTYIHCCYFSDEEWELVRQSQGKISIAPQVEMQMGHGWPPVMKAREHGLRPSLSIDVVTTVPGDMFTEMRCAFAAERWRSNDSVWESEAPIPDNDAHRPRHAHDGDPRRRLRGRARGPHRVDHAGQAGRHRGHRRQGPGHQPGHRPGGHRGPVRRHGATSTPSSSAARCTSATASWSPTGSRARDQLQASTDHLVDALAKAKQEQPSA